MKLGRVLGGAAFAGIVTVAFACGSSDDASSFSIALVVEGEGTVTSDPSGFDCRGPRDCGTHTFAGAAVTLAPVAAAGWAFVKARVDDVDAAPTPPIRVEARASRQKVVVTFVRGSGGPLADGGAEGGAVSDSGGLVDTGSGDASFDVSSATTCNGAQCGVGQTCCLTQIAQTADWEFSCKANCTVQGFEASCFDFSDCTGGTVCCLTPSNGSGPGSLTCKPPAACQGNRLCDDSHPCDVDAGFFCAQFGPVGFCGQPT